MKRVGLLAVVAVTVACCGLSSQADAHGRSRECGTLRFPSTTAREISVTGGLRCSKGLRLVREFVRSIENSLGVPGGCAEERFLSECKIRGFDCFTTHEKILRQFETQCDENHRGVYWYEG
jgi:hypothetical protein